MELLGRELAQVAGGTGVNQEQVRSTKVRRQKDDIERPEWRTVCGTDSRPLWPACYPGTSRPNWPDSSGHGVKGHSDTPSSGAPESHRAADLPPNWQSVYVTDSAPDWRTCFQVTRSPIWRANGQAEGLDTRQASPANFANLAAKTRPWSAAGFRRKRANSRAYAPLPRQVLTPQMAGFHSTHGWI